MASPPPHTRIPGQRSFKSSLERAETGWRRRPRGGSPARRHRLVAPSSCMRDGGPPPTRSPRDVAPPQNEALEPPQDVLTSRAPAPVPAVAPPLHASMVTDSLFFADVSPRSGAPVLDFGRSVRASRLGDPGRPVVRLGGRGDACRDRHRARGTRLTL